MTGCDEQSRFLAACEQCGSVYAAQQHAEGEIVPIGKPDGCACGGTTFSKIEESPESTPVEDRRDCR
ncbi:hypothetical protein [Natrarchaeobius oligotrophus]|uniref:Uncharacterized protein n=1 Tax=Natrarchaeobius chitinivorans TaxID=1679083 RepID=A0A3N6MRN1_NATCH|nr:hypothetical protein [Natrarchaeobius chitinivorans]RQH00421.1 hypothetical protein EA472_11300 [Natrarchaeobius chitinivorans]